MNTTLPKPPTPGRVLGDTLRETSPADSKLQPAPSPAGLYSTDMHGRQLVTRCSWCKRIRTPDQAWLNDEWSALVRKDFETSARHSFTDGMCPNCQQEMEQELAALKLMAEAEENPHVLLSQMLVELRAQFATYKPALVALEKCAPTNPLLLERLNELLHEIHDFAHATQVVVLRKQNQPQS